jgi:hypothetical protein
MKLDLLLGISAVYMAFAGLGFIFAPQAAGAGAVPADPSAALIAYLRIFGSPFLGIAVLNWAARNAEPSAALNAVILGNIVGFSAIAALDVWGLFAGARQATQVFAVIHLLFAAAFIRAGWAGMRGGTGEAGRFR